MPEISTASLQKVVDTLEPRCTGCGEAATLAHFANAYEPYKDYYCDTCELPHEIPPASTEDVGHAVELREILAAL